MPLRCLSRAWAPVLLLLLTSCGHPTQEYQDLNDEGLREYKAGHYPEALAMFKDAAEKDRERPEASYYIGLCYLRMGDQNFREGDTPGAMRYTDKAIATFDSAIAAFPGYSRAVQAKADALKLQGKHKAALELAAWASVNSGLQAQKLIIEGQENALAGDIDKAELAYKKAVAVEPDNAAAHAQMGLFYMRCGNDAEAIKALRRAYELNPGAPGVVAALARLGALSEPKSNDSKP